MSTKPALSVIWLLSGALVVKLVSVWERLPERMAVHFGMTMQPNGWSRKSGFAAMVLFAVLGQAALATFVLLRVGSAAGLIAPVLVLVNFVLVSAFWQTLNYNVAGARFQPLWLFVPLLLLFASLTLFTVKLTLDYYRH